MGLISKIKNLIWINKAEQDFDLHLAEKKKSDEFLSKCASIYEGRPYWLDDDTRTINMAKSVCSEVARLTTMNIKIDITGSARATYLKEQVDKTVDELRRWVEIGCAYGEVIIKPNGYGIDVVLPTQYMVTESFGSEVMGIVFFDEYFEPKSEKYYTRLEYHRFIEDKYLITNKCYVGDSRNDFGTSIDIKRTRWSDLQEETTAEGVDKMLFGYLKMPSANNYNITSHKGMPIFSDAVSELEDVDIAYSRFATEISDSSRTVIIDSDRLLTTGGKVGAGNKDALIAKAGLPRFIKAVEGTGQGDIYHEINPTLNTETRIKGINALLSQIGFKCGFSNGYFVFNEKTGMVTATQVESDDRRTLQLVGDVRKQLETCMDGLIYALDKFADAYDLAPRGKYEVTYDMADLTENHEEDKRVWLSYVQQGWISFKYYLVKFEGLTEEEADELVTQAEDEKIASAQKQAGALYGVGMGQPAGNPQGVPNGEQPEQKPEQKEKVNA